MIRGMWGRSVVTVAALLVLAVVCPAARADDIDLTGKWVDNDGNTCSVRQVGDAVWWVSRSKDGGKSWTNVFHGKITARQLTGHFADVPDGDNRNQGSITARLIVKDGAAVELKGEVVFSPSNERLPFFLKRDR
jgi:hypothetical protein